MGCNFCKSPSIGDVKSRALRWAGHVVQNGKYGIQKEFLCGNLLGIVHLEDQQRDGRIILRQIRKICCYSRM
jgi:hypothetical protein